ncbi:hypothetical protein [Sphingomonas sp. Ant H11]|uniref:hypothetical protein n=1 Tax=Sphingomonas sp. Ant H11 TaxID=1564113 RepID=UPI0018CE01C3|nr:hypothetical protein [Sphingomonas sp. Ant H11]
MAAADSRASTISTWPKRSVLRLQSQIFSPFRVGHSSINEPINDERWTFIWGVTIVSNFGGAPIDVLLCELAAGRPAGTDIILLS